MSTLTAYVTDIDRAMAALAQSATEQADIMKSIVSGFKLKNDEE